MGRVGYGPSLYGPSWLWAEFVMGRDVQLPYLAVRAADISFLRTFMVTNNLQLYIVIRT